MYLGTVVGDVVSTHKNERLEGKNCSWCGVSRWTCSRRVPS